MIRGVAIAPLLQALSLGAAIGVGWGAYTSWPRPQALIPGVVTSPRTDATAVPLPRFTPTLLAQLARGPINSPETTPPRRPPVSGTLAPGTDRPRPPAQVEEPATATQPASAEAPEEPAAPPTEAAVPADDVELALASFRKGYQLYRRFVVGDGDRAQVGPEARAQLEEARALLEAAQRRHREQARTLERRIEEVDSYLGFLVHYGG